MEGERVNRILIALSNLLQFCVDYIDHNIPSIFLFIRLLCHYKFSNRNIQII